MYICNYMYILDYTRLIDTHRLVFFRPSLTDVWPHFRAWPTRWQEWRSNWTCGPLDPGRSNTKSNCPWQPVACTGHQHRPILIATFRGEMVIHACFVFLWVLGYWYLMQCWSKPYHARDDQHWFFPSPMGHPFVDLGVQKRKHSI